MGKEITWLHLSDLHFYGPKTGWDARRVLQTLPDDLLKMQREHNLRPDLLFFTGDAAFGHVRSEPGHNIADQFDSAHEFLEGVRQTFDPVIPRENVFLVPGNHDVNRHLVTPDQTAWLDNITDINTIDEMVHDQTVQWKRYLERLDDYFAFLRRHGYDHLTRGNRGFIYSETRDIRGVRVGIAGLNSAWSCGRNAEKGKLWMACRWQIEHLLPSLSRADIKIALVHHPSNWMVEFEDPSVRRIIEADFDFCLHGHEHQEWVEQAGKHTRIAAGACYEASDHDNGYNFVRLDGEKTTGEVWLRRYHPRGRGWVPDIIPGVTDNNGLQLLSGLRHLVSPSNATPANVVTARPATSNEHTIAKSQERRDFRSYGSDLPPIVDAWVGRQNELTQLNSMRNGVVAITGIGGQGKSTLVSKFLDDWRRLNPEGVWDWRDCREEGDRFHTQLVSMTENLTEGHVTGKHLAGADIKALIRYIFELMSSKHGVIVLDNVDHYVDVSENEFAYDVAVFVQEALRVQHNLLIILTCRPRVSYASPRFLEIHLRGMDFSEAVELFRLRGITSNETKTQEQVRELWSLTAGHPLWLNLIAVQMSRQPANAPLVIAELRKGTLDEGSRTMFRAVWNGLNERQQIILRCMAEMSFPEAIVPIYGFVKSKIRAWNHFHRAFKGLRTLSLVVERGSANQETKYDLHPLVRGFIRSEFPGRKDRLPFIRPILLFIEGLFRDVQQPNEDTSIELLERWITKAELESASGNADSSIETICSASDPLIAKGLLEEFSRVAKLILDGTDWNSPELRKQSHFHELVRSLVYSLAELGRIEDARAYLNRYETTVDRGTFEFISLCETACYFEWFVGNFETAIRWGQAGVTFKSTSKIDTNQDCSHTLALAFREAGRLDEALSIFAEGVDINVLLYEDHNSSGRSASYYGNIGRCLYLNGQYTTALNFFSKSFDLLKSSMDSLSVLNKGYAALWIGEALEASNDYDTAELFYRLCLMIWTSRAPLRLDRPRQRIEYVSRRHTSNFEGLSNSDITATCKTWVENYLKQTLGAIQPT